MIGRRRGRYKTMATSTLTVGIKALELRICYSLVFILRNLFLWDASLNAVMR